MVSVDILVPDLRGNDEKLSLVTPVPSFQIIPNSHPLPQCQLHIPSCSKQFSSLFPSPWMFNSNAISILFIH